jgi:sugar lactone lactonase YvrE
MRETRMFGRGVAAAAVMVTAVAMFAAQDPAAPIVVSSGLSTPESALYDPTADMYLVSNINGNPSAKDGNGFISRVAPDGSVNDLKWIDGARPDVTLHAPKGMAFRGDTLLVADIDTIRLFDRKSGKPAGTWEVPGSTFMNDIAVGSDNRVYATDTGIDLSGGEPKPTGTAAVYRFDQKGAPTAIARGKELGGPNGVHAGPDGLTVVDFMSNRVLRVSGDGKVTTHATLPQGGLDGIERLADGSFLISSWEASAIFRLGADGKATVIVKDVPSPADLGVDTKRNRLLIPLFQKDALQIVRIP